MDPGARRSSVVSPAGQWSSAGAKQPITAWTLIHIGYLRCRRHVIGRFLDLSRVRVGIP